MSPFMHGLPTQAGVLVIMVNKDTELVTLRREFDIDHKIILTSKESHQLSVVLERASKVT